MRQASADPTLRQGNRIHNQPAPRPFRRIELCAPPQFEVHAHHVAEINSNLLVQANNPIYSRTSQVAMLRDDQIMTCDLQRLFSGWSGR